MSDDPKLPGREVQVQPSDVWLALSSIPRPSRVVDVPRLIPGTKVSVGEVAIWALTQQEQAACTAEADRFTRQLMRDPAHAEQTSFGYHHLFACEYALQTLARACRNPKNLQQPAFPSPKLLRPKLTDDELTILFNSYLTVHAELSPCIDRMDPEEFENFVLRIAESGSALPFEELSWDLQRTAVVALALQLAASWATTAAETTTSSERTA